MAIHKRLTLVAGYVTPSNEYVLNEITKPSSSDNIIDFIFPNTDDTEVLKETYTTPAVAEMLLRKALHESLKFQKPEHRGLLAITDLLFSPQLSVSDGDTRVVDRLAHIYEHPMEKLLFRNQEYTLFDFLKIYSLEDLRVYRNQNVLFHGDKDVIVLKFRTEFLNTLDYNDPHPMNQIVLYKIKAFMEDCLEARSIQDRDPFMNQTKDDIKNEKENNMASELVLVEKKLSEIEIREKSYKEELEKIVREKLDIEFDKAKTSEEKAQALASIEVREKEFDERLVKMSSDKNTLETRKRFLDKELNKLKV